MSFTEKGRKVRPNIGKEIPSWSTEARSCDFAHLIAAALRRDFGDSHAAVKLVAGLAGANERAVKNWYEARNGPTGEHLVDLMRSSEEVLEAVLSMCGRSDLLVAKKVADSKRELRKMLMLLHEIESDRIRVAVDRILALRCDKVEAGGGHVESCRRHQCRNTFRLRQISTRRRSRLEFALDPTGGQRASH